VKCSHSSSCPLWPHNPFPNEWYAAHVGREVLPLGRGLRICIESGRTYCIKVNASWQSLGVGPEPSCGNMEWTIGGPGSSFSGSLIRDQVGWLTNHIKASRQLLYDFSNEQSQQSTTYRRQSKYLRSKMSSNSWRWPLNGLLDACSDKSRFCSNLPHLNRNGFLIPTHKPAGEMALYE